MFQNLKYQKPKITKKRIKLSFFLTNISWIDQFNLVGKVYAQSDCGAAANCTCSHCNAGGWGNSSGCNSTANGGSGGACDFVGSDPSMICFLPGTQILLPNGTSKNIEDIRPNDEICSSHNEQKSKSKVMDLLIHTRSGGYLIFNDLLKVTDDHPLFINSGWLKAGMAKIGDKLLTSSGEEVEIKKIDKVGGNHTVYNLNVEGENKNYFADDFLARVYGFD